MTRELVGLKVDLTTVDINSGYVTHCQSKTNPRYPMQLEKIIYPVHKSLILPMMLRQPHLKICAHQLAIAQNSSPLVMPVKTLPECNAIYGTISEIILMTQFHKVLSLTQVMFCSNKMSN